jgi:hypothetical protein
MTFFIGTVLAFGWFTFNNNPIKSQMVSSPLGLEIKTPTIVAAQTSLTPFVVSKNTQVDDYENSRPIHFIKDGGENCEKYLLKKIAKEKSGSNQMIKLKNFDYNDKTLSSNVKKWLENMREDKLITFELGNNEQKALLLS